MPDYDAKAIGERVRRARRAAELTQDDLADKLKVKARTVQRWENAETTRHLRDLGTIARALGVTTDYLLGVDGSGDGRVADLEAEVHDLRAQVDALTQLLRDPERLLREADALLREAPDGPKTPPGRAPRRSR
jgi:HTH-type transcriptional regulator, cell division transcriptional repressor